MKDPVFESQTKNKLGNTEIRSDLVNKVREELLHFFNRNKEIAEKIMAKVADTRQLRKELQEVKKLARERAKAITLRIPQLRDCKVHLDKKKGKWSFANLPIIPDEFQLRPIEKTKARFNMLKKLMQRHDVDLAGFRIDRGRRPRCAVLTSI